MAIEKETSSRKPSTPQDSDREQDPPQTARKIPGPYDELDPADKMTTPDIAGETFRRRVTILMPHYTEERTAFNIRFVEDKDREGAKWALTASNPKDFRNKVDDSPEEWFTGIVTLWKLHQDATKKISVLEEEAEDMRSRGCALTEALEESERNVKRLREGSVDTPLHHKEVEALRKDNERLRGARDHHRTMKEGAWKTIKALEEEVLQLRNQQGNHHDATPLDSPPRKGVSFLKRDGSSSEIPGNPFQGRYADSEPRANPFSGAYANTEPRLPTQFGAEPFRPQGIDPKHMRRPEPFSGDKWNPEEYEIWKDMVHANLRALRLTSEQDKIEWVRGYLRGTAYNAVKERTREASRNPYGALREMIQDLDNQFEDKSRKQTARHKLHHPTSRMKEGEAYTVWFPRFNNLLAVLNLPDDWARDELMDHITDKLADRVNAGEPPTTFAALHARLLKLDEAERLRATRNASRFDPFGFRSQQEKPGKFQKTATTKTPSAQKPGSQRKGDGSTVWRPPLLFRKTVKSGRCTFCGKEEHKGDDPNRPCKNDKPISDEELAILLHAVELDEDEDEGTESESSTEPSEKA